MVLLAAVELPAGSPPRQQTKAPGAMPEEAAPMSAGRTLIGSVRAGDGKALGGVVVSARAADKTITVSVFTDEQGGYIFPALDSGTYRLWAQAVGFQTARGKVTL